MKAIQQLCLAILAAVILATGLIAVVEADPGGRAWGYGYFTNAGKKTNGFGQVITGGVTATTNKTTFINEIEGELNGGGLKSTGAAFIIQTMRGGTVHTRPSAAEVADWKARVNDPAVTISLGNYGYVWNSGYMKNFANDDAFYKYTDNRYSLIFKVNGTISYVLKQECGNPVGDLGGLPQPKPKPQPKVWQLSASSTANRTTAKPGDIITWTHILKNGGPNATDKSVKYGYQNGGNLGTAFTTPYTLASGSAKGTTKTFTSRYTVTQADVGKNLCRSTLAKPKAWNDGSWLITALDCVTVPYAYSLTPGVTTNASGIIEPNTTFAVTPSVSNTGPTKSNATQWQVTQIIVLPGKIVPNPAGGLSASNAPPCGNYFRAPPGASCSTVKTGTTVFDENGGWLSGAVLSASNVTVGDLAVGTKLCFAYSLQPYSSSSTEWRHSAPVCLVVGKRPKVQVQGGDLTVGKTFVGAPVISSVRTSKSIKTIGTTQNTFGSWIEYGIFATGSVTGAASGSAYAGPSGMANATDCLASRLSFTNNNNVALCDAIGKYTTPRSIPDVAASFASPGAIISGTITPNNLLATAGTYIGTSGSDLVLDVSVLDPGKSVILKASGTVTIIGNQTYNPDNNGAKYSSASQLPQLVIIANKIIINDNVTNVDAWLIASGVDGIVETCNTGSPTYVLNDPLKLTSDKCKTPLTVNGPVMAKQLWLRRTAGSGTDLASGDPAEVFNLRPDAYLWAATRATGSGRVQTMYTTELPPRL